MRETFLLVVMLQVAIAQNDIVTKTLHAPLLPFHLGESRIVESKHTFIHYIEFIPIINQLENIKHFYFIVNNSLNATRYIKPASPHYAILRTILRHAEYLMLEVENKLNNIIPHFRQKRALLNIVGRAEKWLFGTLDSDDEKRYDQAISELSNNQNQISKEVVMQVSLTKQLIANYNATITLLDSNQKLIINQLAHFKNNINKTINDITAFLEAQNILNQVILNSQNLITFLDNLEDALTFAKLNALHNSVISALEVEHMVKYLTDIYGINKIPKFNNVNSYYKLIGIQAKYSNDRLLFALHFPILIDEAFDLYRLYPIPLNQSIIIPDAPYLILGTTSQQYENEVCPIIEQVYFCQNNLQPQVNSCVASMVNGGENTHCKATEVQVIKPILEPIDNQYIIVIPGIEPVNMLKKCSGNNFVHIKEPSLVKIPFNCSVQIKTWKYWNKEEAETGKPFALPEIKITMFNRQKPITPDGPLQLHSINLEEVHQLQKMAEILPIEKVHWIHPLVWSSGSVFIILALVAIMVLVFWKVYLFRIIEKRKPSQDTENKPVSVLFSS